MNILQKIFAQDLIRENKTLNTLLDIAHGRRDDLSDKLRIANQQIFDQTNLNKELTKKCIKLQKQNEKWMNSLENKDMLLKDYRDIKKKREQEQGQFNPLAEMINSSRNHAQKQRIKDLEAEIQYLREKYESKNY